MNTEVQVRKGNVVEAAIVVIGLTFMVRASSDLYDILKGKVVKTVEETRND